MVSLETFSALDIRIGKIVNAEEHEKARKPMYKLTVDFGSSIGTRTIIAGIRDQYGKDELLGKKVACIINLEPKIIAGVESQGMMLAAGEEKISVLVPEREVDEGSRVH